MHRHLGSLLSGGHGADITVQVGDETFAAHRCVLAARSPVFTAELFGPMGQNNKETIHVHDMEPRVFEAMLHFIYNDSLPKEDDDEVVAMAQHLLVAADRYGVERLKLICEDTLCSHVDASTAGTTLALAEQHHCEGLKEACFKVVMESETLQVKVNQAVHRALSNPSGVLLNTLQKLIKRMVDELIDQRVHLWRQIEEKQQYQLGGQAHQYLHDELYQQYRPKETQRYLYEEDWADRTTKLVNEQVGLKPKEQTYMYRLPYPEWFDRVPLPHQYKVPDFSKYSGQDDISTMEHICRFLAQCGEASAEEALKVKLFPLSLTGSVFTWFLSLPPNSIRGWVDLEKQFHEYFFARIDELKLSDLLLVKQQEGESAMEYIKRFRNIRSRCYSLSLSDEQLADLAFQGLSTPIKDRLFFHEFNSLAHLMKIVSTHERLNKREFRSMSPHTPKIGGMCNAKIW
uniref:Retrotransposon protein, putative, unclassified n=1 Tax=Oryza sativa subsp. japonica TaxID=39947 RepID=Q2R116_ORYSJ|nr:uncharacterized protein LOC107279274 [Oryza sativa Japonica Group]ABA94831.1 retrotransposon protein, putative, unclassified [Oryza sativa Japonica Group]